MSVVLKQSISTLLKGNDLTQDQADNVINDILSGSATPSQIGAFLVLLQSKRVTLPVLHAFTSKILSLATFPPSFKHRPSNEILVDIVGTGGDGRDTFNASTAAGFLIAACKVKVAKMGNRASSSNCGSADFIERLGSDIMLDGVKVSNVIDSCGFGFLFAPQFYPVMKSVSAIRKELGIRTIFNILGPLLNPLQPPYLLIGVSSLELGPLFAQFFASRPTCRNAMIVCSTDGIDEISPSAPTHYWLVKKTTSIDNTEITEGVLSPSDFGLPLHDLDLVCSLSIEERVSIFKDILSGHSAENGKRGQILQAVLDFIVLNAAAVLTLVGVANDFKDGAEKAKATIQNGTALECFKSFIQASSSSSS